MADGKRSVSILMATAEATPFAKTGGLADVCGALPRALARRGHRCAVVMPLYKAVRDDPRFHAEPTDHSVAVPMGWRTVPARLWRAPVPNSDAVAYFVENADLFERDDPAYGRGIYQYRTHDGDLADYHDNGERFTFFCRAALEAVPLVNGGETDILHANDWQAGLTPAYLKELYRYRPHYKRMRSLFTIHNLAYQGVFPAEMMGLVGLDGRLFNSAQLEFYNQLNFLKAGVVFADWVNTVSPSYAMEIQTKLYGCGLEGVLSEKRYRLSGVNNGIDFDEWDPATDPHLPAHYSAADHEAGKAACKAALQEELGLDVKPDVPLLGVVARLVEQKGIDIILAAVDQLADLGVQLAALGTGRAKFHTQLEEAQARHPGRVAARLQFDVGLSHRIEAGCDFFLMPSSYEPAGLNQLYSLRYGSVPIVRATGGLIDTVTEATAANLVADRATGFKFIPYSARALVEAVERAVSMYRDQPAQFKHLVRTGMEQDWSWDRIAGQYEDLYLRLIDERDAASRKPFWRQDA